MWLFLSKIVLPLLVTAGFLSTLKLGVDDGLLRLLQARTSTEKPVLEDSNVRLVSHFTGISSVDEHLTLAVSFFWPVLNGSYPDITLQGIHFFGQLAATWTLLIIESFRVGNSWKTISFITIWGLLIENVAAAVVVPAFALTHLLTSPTVSGIKSQREDTRRAALLVHPLELKVIPWSVMIGLGIPTVMSVYCDASIATPVYASKQFWISVRQLHPALTCGAHVCLSMLIPALDDDFGSPRHRNKRVLEALQPIYDFALYLAMVPHIGVLAVLGAARAMPGLISQSNIRLIDPAFVFQPSRAILGEVRAVTSIRQGVKTFLQWDEVVFCVSILVWAFAVNRECLSWPKPRKSSGLLATVARVFTMTLIGGPAAAAISLIRDRDWNVLYLETGEREEGKEVMT